MARKRNPPVVAVQRRDGIVQLALATKYVISARISVDSDDPKTLYDDWPVRSVHLSLRQAQQLADTLREAAAPETEQLWGPIAP